MLGRVLSTKAKVVVLVDNLDKAWTESADLKLLSEFLYGVLNVSARVAHEFSKDSGKRDVVNMYFTLFVRSDIHAAMVGFVKERDKLPIRRLTWEDPELLRRVVEERFIKSGANVAYPPEIWERYFPPSVGGLPSREFLIQQILPRPRDLIFIVKAALQFAINRGHTRIEENDIRSGQDLYSRFALDSLIVEATPRVPSIEDVLLHLVGATNVVPEETLREAVKSAGITEDPSVIIDTLGELTFIGYEVAPNRFEFLYDRDATAKIAAMARKNAEQLRNGERHFLIHPAYQAYLELKRTDAAPGQMFIQM
jgi:hypothetical protein